MTIALSQSISPASIVEKYGATWQDYLALRESELNNWQKIAFDQGWLWANMGKEGPNHAAFRDLLTMIFGFWVFLHPDPVIQSYGRCLIEKPETQACAPDLVLYKGDNIPRWQWGELRRIDLEKHRLPDLVGEISDTTLSLDLDEQKQLYASLGIAEYWVIDVKGQRIFAFGLLETGDYESIEVSRALSRLSISLIEQTLERLSEETNTAAASWLMQQLSDSNISSNRQP